MKDASGGVVVVGPVKGDNVPVLLMPGETFCPITKAWCIPCGGKPCIRTFIFTCRVGK